MFLIQANTCEYDSSCVRICFSHFVYLFEEKDVVVNWLANISLDSYPRTFYGTLSDIVKTAWYYPIKIPHMIVTISIMSSQVRNIGRGLIVEVSKYVPVKLQSSSWIKWDRNKSSYNKFFLSITFWKKDKFIKYFLKKIFIVIYTSLVSMN